MTPAQHVQRVRQIAFQMWRADYGLGMPRDYQLVLQLKTFLAAAEEEAVAAIHDAFVNGEMKYHEAIEALLEIGEDEAERVVSEWADGAQADADADADADAERALYAPDPEQV